MFQHTAAQGKTPVVQAPTASGDRWRQHHWLACSSNPVPTWRGRARRRSNVRDGNRNSRHARLPCSCRLARVAHQFAPVRVGDAALDLLPERFRWRSAVACFSPVPSGMRTRSNASIRLLKAPAESALGRGVDGMDAGAALSDIEASCCGSVAICIHGPVAPARIAVCALRALIQSTLEQAAL